MTKGALHPISQILRVTVSAFTDMGFEIVDAPEVDTPWYNFDSLRMPEGHPARAGHDTFWLTDGRLLRTHTTNMQLHVVEQRKPPLRVMHFGPCYRNEATDATHDIMFTHLDCLVIDEGITIANLLSVLDSFITRLFGSETKYRFRPHNFPFTEPSIEVDIWHNGRWIELLGSGMVHPEVLKNMNIDPTVYSGFAFGIGIDRIALIKWGIEDTRLSHTNKISFLRQFRATA
jgi:phenylalanyl-tRNA synthetase alpha chain